MPSFGVGSFLSHCPRHLGIPFNLEMNVLSAKNVYSLFTSSLQFSVLFLAFLFILDWATRIFSSFISSCLYVFCFWNISLK